MNKYKVCVIGASGLVGRTLVSELFIKKFPLKELVLCASDVSDGKEIYIDDRKFYLQKIREDIFIDCDFVFFCAGSEVSKEWVEVARKYNCIVIDNSSYFRMRDDCSLIIPEVNIFDLDIKKVIANPNCSTIQSVLCLNALSKYGLKKVIYNTYQSISGSGNKAIIDRANYYIYDINKTCIPKIDNLYTNGFTIEEMKMINETKKILNLKNLDVVATCVRVPVDYCHGVSIVVELDEDVDIKKIYEDFSKQEGIVLSESLVFDDAFGNDKVYVGRIRKDIVNSKTLMFYCIADNLRRGAASNAVLIALKIIENGLAYKN